MHMKIPQSDQANDSNENFRTTDIKGNSKSFPNVMPEQLPEHTQRKGIHYNILNFRLPHWMLKDGNDAFQFLRENELYLVFYSHPNYQSSGRVE